MSIESRNGMLPNGVAPLEPNPDKQAGSAPDALNQPRSLVPPALENGPGGGGKMSRGEFNKLALLAVTAPFVAAAGGSEKPVAEASPSSEDIRRLGIIPESFSGYVKEMNEEGQETGTYGFSIKSHKVHELTAGHDANQNFAEITFSGLKSDDAKKVASLLGVPDKEIENWLTYLGLATAGGIAAIAPTPIPGKGTPARLRRITVPTRRPAKPEGMTRRDFMKTLGLAGSATAVVAAGGGGAALAYLYRDELSADVRSLLGGLAVLPTQNPSTIVEGTRRPVSSATATVKKENTPVPTLTLTPKSTGTKEPSKTPTPTVTIRPSETPTPTETLVPTFIWKTDFENGFAGFDDFLNIQGGVSMKIVDDPTGSKRGKVLSGTITGKAEEKNGYAAFRAYPGKSVNLNYPIRVEQDIWMSQDFFDSVQSSWFSDLSIFDSTPSNGGNWHINVTSALGYHDGKAGEDNITLNIQDPDKGIQDFMAVKTGAPKFKPETWHNMAITIDKNGFIQLYQDGIIVSTGKQKDSSRRKVAFIHGGPIYGGESLKGNVLVDNLKITSWG